MHSMAQYGTAPHGGFSAERENLYRLILIRILVLCGQGVALFYFTKVQPLGLPLAALLLVLLIYALLTLLTWARIHFSAQITSLEFFAHLLVDIVFFSTILYLSGGASNPFISYYLIPISIAAIALPRLLSAATTVCSLLAYTLLLKFFVPIPELAPAHHGSEIGLHVLGMWVNFALSAAIITYFVSQMAATVRRQQRELALQHEDQLRNEQLLAIGTLAAGTAHELGTPLNTMKLVVDDLSSGERLEKTDLDTLQHQLDHCRETLQQLVETARQSNERNHSEQNVRVYFEQLIERWRLLRPEVQATVRLGTTLQDAHASFHPTIAQSLMNLLNNAGDAARDCVSIDIDSSTTEVQMLIRDDGPGLDPALSDAIGTPFTSGKSNGLGLGLFLSQTTLSRYGGTVRLQNAAGGGTLTTVCLPLCDT